jgi:hypothetical protein
MQIVKIGGFDQILCDHDDGMIAKTIIYTGESTVVVEDTLRCCKAYADPERTIEIPMTQLIEAFFKGCVCVPHHEDIMLGGGFTPMGCSDGILLMTFGNEATYILPAEISVDDVLND